MDSVRQTIPFNPVRGFFAGAAGSLDSTPRVCPNCRVSVEVGKTDEAISLGHLLEAVGIGVSRCNHSGDAKGALDVIIDQMSRMHDRGNKRVDALRQKKPTWLCYVTYHQVIPLVGRKMKKYMDAFMVL